jgi:hypothetical protein
VWGAGFPAWTAEVGKGRYQWGPGEHTVYACRLSWCALCVPLLRNHVLRTDIVIIPSLYNFGTRGTPYTVVCMVVVVVALRSGLCFIFMLMLHERKKAACIYEVYTCVISFRVVN